MNTTQEEITDIELDITRNNMMIMCTEVEKLINIYDAKANFLSIFDPTAFIKSDVGSTKFNARLKLLQLYKELKDYLLINKDLLS